LFSAAPARGIGAEVADVGADPVQRGQRVADPGVGEMTLAVDREAVAAQQLAGRPRLDPGQVDPADGELGQHLEQCAGVVVPDERDQARLVPSGRRRRRTRPGQQHEPGHPARVVGDVLGQRLQLRVCSRDRRRDRRVVLPLPHRHRRPRGRPGEHDVRAGQVRAQPSPRLRLGVRVGGDRSSPRPLPYPAGTSSENVTGSRISRTICSGAPVASSSRVVATDPSTEFSIGTTAASASSARTASIAAGTVRCGNVSAPSASGTVRSAASANVPSGPRYAKRVTPRTLSGPPVPVSMAL
jgi:hypothetical protein